LRRRGYNIRLILIGTSRIEASNNVEQRQATPKEIAEILCKSKSVVLPSSYEAPPYVVLEAMACGTPIVVSNAVPEEVVVNNFNGIRVNSFNPEDYANALEKLLSNEELWLKLSRNGQEFIKRFDYVKIAKSTRRLLRGYCKMPHYLPNLVKEADGVKDLLKLALYERRFFKNRLTSLITAALSYTGIAKRNHITIKCVDNHVSEIPLMTFRRLLDAPKMNVIKRYDCCKGVTELINGVSTPIDEVANSDVVRDINWVSWHFANRNRWLTTIKYMPFKT
jgi:hypothetical protein